MWLLSFRPRERGAFRQLVHSMSMGVRRYIGPVTLPQRLADIAEVLAPVRDVIDGRVSEAEAPAWCDDRGWTPWLSGLTDDQLASFDRGAWPSEEEGAPLDLAALGASVRDVLAWIPHAESSVEGLGVAHQRKDRQVEALLGVVAGGSWKPRRVVDFGSGLGRLTRALAKALEIPTLGIERDAARVARAELANEDERVRFTVHAVRAPASEGDRDVASRRDVQVAGRDDETMDGTGRADGTESDVRFCHEDLLVGLHTCGGLGDAVVQSAIRSGAGIALVGCCLQKIDGSAREPLSAAGRNGGLRLSRDVLGLTNLAGRAHGVGGSAVQIAERRELRHALRLLLAGRGIVVEAGAESRGVTRRRFDRGLADAAGHAFARRGLQPPSAAELEAAVSRARREFPLIRRLSVPRVLLGRLLEVAVVLDRACVLHEAGRSVTVQPVFGANVSPRNLGLVAAPA